MSLKIPLFDEPLVIKYKGVYDFDGLYKLIRQWFKERNYDFSEPLYKDKSGGPFGNEIELKLYGEKKITEFIKYHIQLETWKIEMKEFDAKIDGEVKKVTDGRMSVTFTEVAIEFDWQNKFKDPREPEDDADQFEKLKYKFKSNLYGTGLLKNLVTKILRRYYEIKFMGPLEGEAYDLHEKLKKHLGSTSTQLK
ncbi:MAG: hypothetical protein ACMXX9_00940 [Candidatus Woesearchaeota archaeon]